MGCSGSKSDIEDVTSMAELQRKQDAIAEAELHKLMHDKQVRLTKQARPLLESRNSMRNLVDDEGVTVTLADLRKRRQEQQALVQREAKEEKQWVVSIIFSVVLI